MFAEISTAQVRSVSVFGALYVLCGRVQGFRHFFYLRGRRSILCTLLRRWQAWVWEVLEVFFMRGAIFGATFGELWRCFQMTFTSTVLIRTPRLHFVGGKRHNFHKRCWQLKSWSNVASDVVLVVARCLLCVLDRFIAMLILISRARNPLLILRGSDGSGCSTVLNYFDILCNPLCILCVPECSRCGRVLIWGLAWNSSRPCEKPLWSPLRGPGMKILKISC